MLTANLSFETNDRLTMYNCIDINGGMGVAILLTLTPKLTPDFQSSKVKEYEF